MPWGKTIKLNEPERQKIEKQLTLTAPELQQKGPSFLHSQITHDHSALFKKKNIFFKSQPFSPLLLQVHPHHHYHQRANTHKPAELMETDSCAFRWVSNPDLAFSSRFSRWISSMMACDFLCRWAIFSALLWDLVPGGGRDEGMFSFRASINKDGSSLFLLLGDGWKVTLNWKKVWGCQDCRVERSSLTFFLMHACTVHIPFRWKSVLSLHMYSQWKLISTTVGSGNLGASSLRTAPPLQMWSILTNAVTIFDSKPPPPQQC